MADNDLDTTNLLAKIDSSGRGIELEDVEKKLLIEALEKSGGNQTKAAALLGISRDTMRYRMKKFGIK